MNFVCSTCGTQFAESTEPPAACPICEDERQYVGLDGQQWTTLDDVRLKHRNEIREEEHSLTSFHTEPHFGIGQRAFLVQTSQGNILWDCLSLLDQGTIDFIQSHGGLRAIAISHPHYYTTMVEWSRAFGRSPVFLHEADRPWIMRPDPCLHFWRGETRPLFAGLTLVHCGGHFAGGTVLHWPSGAGGKGALLTGDVLQVVPDRRWVSFMYSYPNYIPLPAAAVERIEEAVEPFLLDRIYGAFPKMTIDSGAKEAVRRSVQRYLLAIGTTQSEQS